MSRVNLIKNYITNADEIIDLAEKESHKFSIRAPGHTYNFSTDYGNSQLKSLFYFNMSEELKQAVWRTIPDDKDDIEGFVINRYDPGDYLLRHRDSAGGYWKFKLIFLRSDESHFVYYDETGAHLVKEEPGAMLDMPINIEHEVTKIGEHEKPKYSLVLHWGM